MMPGTLNAESELIKGTWVSETGGDERMNINRQWVLAKRPHGVVTENDFEYREVPIPEPGEVPQ